MNVFKWIREYIDNDAGLIAIIPTALLTFIILYLVEIRVIFPNLDIPIYEWFYNKFTF